MNEELPFDDYRREMFGLRLKIAERINIHRGHFGTNDGIAADGSHRRYDDPMWQRIEEALQRATHEIFLAEKEIFSLPPTPAKAKTETVTV